MWVPEFVLVADIIGTPSLSLQHLLFFPCTCWRFLHEHPWLCLRPSRAARFMHGAGAMFMEVGTLRAVVS